MLSELLGEKICMSRENTRLQPGDEMFCVRLPYRAWDKKAYVAILSEDYDFYLATYEEQK